MFTNASIQFAGPCDLRDSDDSGAVLSEMIAAIAAMYFEDARKLDVRHLWTRAGLNYFRVNWWSNRDGGAARVRRSAFLVVERRAHGYRVVDATRREAA